MTAAESATALGVHSEVGTLRTVMVHRPDVAHERLTPTNCHELLFDDVIWVRQARRNTMRSSTSCGPGARRCCSSRPSDGDARGPRARGMGPEPQSCARR